MAPFIVDPYRFTSASGTGGWVELGRTTLGSANQFIDVESLPNKKYYMILLDSHGQSSTDGTIRVRYNNTGNGDFEYAGRYQYNGGTDATYVNELSNFIGIHSEDTSPKFRVAYIANKSDKEKLTYGNSIEQNTAGAGNVPNRAEDSEKWDNTTDAISSIEYSTGAGTNTWNTNSEVVVLGWDPADTHTDNFWEELANVELGSAGDNITTGTITAKKYLWIQAYLIPTGTINSNMTFNNDTGNNYSHRYSINGASDGTGINLDRVDVAGSETTPVFVNFFLVNNSANEKLYIQHNITQNTAGAGTAPNRIEVVGKWVNTSAQITEIDIDNSQTGSFDTGSIIKVWGSN